MSATTALTLVNRLLRRHGFDDISILTEPEGLLGLDLVNQAIRDLLSMRDYPWNVRSDGALNLKPTITGTGSVLTVSGDASASMTVTGTITDFTGNFVTRLLITSSTTHSDVPLVVTSAALLGTTLAVNLNAAWPGAGGGGGDYKFFFAEYLLPDTVSKVLSVRHPEFPIQLLEVSPHSSFDEWIPRMHETEDANPMLVAVGGTAVGTVQFGGTANRRLRLMVWPVPTAAVQIQYTYKERFSDLVDTTDTLYAPAEFADDVIDRAEALSNMTQRFNDPDLSQIQMRSSLATAERKYVAATLDPSRRSPLQPHDRGGRRRDFTRYRNITGL